MGKNAIRVAQIMGKWLGGGVEAVVMNYYRNIDRTKIQFDFICDSDSTNIPYDEIKKLGGKVILIPPYQKVFKYHKKLKRVLKEGNYKIVHSHINTLSVFSLFAAKCAGVPVRIAHSHSTTNKKEWKKNLLKQILKPFSKTFATDYMCCSELSGRWLFGNKEYEKGNVYLLNNAIDLDKFKYDEKLRKEKRKELGINDDTLVIGHIGRFVAQKNHTFLIDIFNELHKKKKDSILLLIGQGPLMDEIKEKVEMLGISDSVKFLGQRGDVDELYQVFDVFCLPSLYEGLPVVGVEAQATGNLCILSDDMTKETKVLDTTEFLSLKQSAQEWADTILILLKTYKKHNTKDEISKYGFNIENEAIKLENFYYKKCGEKYMNDLISIVIPVHNAEKYIEVCLKSVILQTYSNLEIIVINDGSTDNSENIIKQQMRKDKRIRLINQKNFGVSLARNIGLKNVNGKYVTFIDADDYVNGDYIQVLYDNLKKMSSEVSICKFTLNEKSYKDTLIEKKYDSKTAIINMLLSLEYDSSVCCKLINSELAKELSFSPDLVIAEDMLYYYNLFKKCNNISFIDKTCYHYIQNSNGAISTISKKKVQNLQIFQKLINECSDLNIKEALINKYISTSFHLLSLDTSKLEKKYLSEIKNNIRIYRKKILFKKNIRLKVKVACALSFFGFNIVDFIMKIERNFKL